MNLMMAMPKLAANAAMTAFTGEPHPSPSYT
jgi:hypothetical protein